LQVIVNEETSEATSDFLSKRLFAIKNQRNAGDTEELALVIGMATADARYL
jgi:phospholipid-transporting ATPase